MTRQKYSGDVDICEGGFFFTIGKEQYRHRYSEITRVTPCSDAGGPGNMWWIEMLMVNLPAREEYAEWDKLLQIVGMTRDNLKGMSPAQRFAAEVCVCVEVGHTDPDDCRFTDLPQSQIVRIGDEDEHWEGRDSFKASTVLSGRVSLRRWIKRTYLRKFP